MVQYSTSDNTIQSFLATIRKGESGNSSTPYSVGYGGTNLSGYSTDSYGFPQWSGVQTSQGMTHAAGAYQFQPGTWQGVASQYGLNFQNQNDQNAGAWYNAQKVYARNTNGGDLYSSLQSGGSGVGSALHSEWTSLSGSTNFSGSSGGSGVISDTWGQSGSTGSGSSTTSPTYGQTGGVGNPNSTDYNVDQNYNSTGTAASSTSVTSSITGWLASIAGRVGLFVLAIVFIIGAIALLALKTGIEIETGKAT